MPDILRSLARDKPNLATSISSESLTFPKRHAQFERQSLLVFFTKVRNPMPFLPFDAIYGAPQH
jgi:hypothetical protein